MIRGLFSSPKRELRAQVTSKHLYIDLYVNLSELTLILWSNSAAEIQTPTAFGDITRSPTHESVIHRAGPKGGPWPSRTAGY